MGGTPLLALSVAAMPEELPTETVRAIFDGAERQVRAAGAVLAGGHTIRDDGAEVRARGRRHRAALDGIWPKSGAQPGDALYLTKPLGTALVLGGAKRGVADAADAVRWMRTLNRDAADALRTFEPNAVTDVTGFGLLGHAHEMATRSGVRIDDRRVAPTGAARRARGGARRGLDGGNAEQPRVRAGRARRRRRRADRARLRPADRRRPARRAAEATRALRSKRRSREQVSSSPGSAQSRPGQDVTLV